MSLLVYLCVVGTLSLTEAKDHRQAHKGVNDQLVSSYYYASYLMPKYRLALLSRAWPEEVHQCLSENRFILLELGPGKDVATRPFLGQLPNYHADPRSPLPSSPTSFSPARFPVTSQALAHSATLC
jgi:hypothetical protein